MTTSVLKNLLICLGAYYLSWWVAPPFAWLFGKATGWIHYQGDFAAAVLLPLVVNLPIAFVAAWAGALIAFLVESRRPALWTALPLALYAGTLYFGHSWIQPPTAVDRIAQVIGALFPAVSCVAGALVGLRQRRYREASASY